MKHKCINCGYQAEDSEFVVSGECPACCANQYDGTINPNGVPTVWYMPELENKDEQNDE